MVMSHSVPSPLNKARNTTMYYYDPNGCLPSLSKYPWSSNINDSVLSPQCRAVLQVAVCYMSRINEILALKVKHICPPDRVISYGSKRSNGYMMLLPGLSEQVEKWVYRDQDTPLFNVSYMRVYRACVKAGIFYNDGSGKNIKVCHSHRYLFAQKNIQKVGCTGVKIALHHKSVKSQKAYLNGKTQGEKLNVEQMKLEV